MSIDRHAAVRMPVRKERSELGVFAHTFPFTLDPFQLEACEALESGQGVLVAAPTGAGKTVVGEFAVHLAVATGRKAFYTTPIKALSNQKYHDLVRRYGSARVGLLTGDVSVNGEAPIVVMTTEVLRNMLYAGSPTLDGLGFVVMDEVHYLADRFRGPVWEEVIIHLDDDVQLVSLSATVSNAEEFGDWLTMVRGDTAVIVSESRPVPLWQHVMVGRTIYDLFADADEPGGRRGAADVNPELVAATRAARGSGRTRTAHRARYPGSAPKVSVGSVRAAPSRAAAVTEMDARALLPAIYFVFSRAGCDDAVAQCLHAGVRLTTAEQQRRIRRIVEERCAELPPEDLDVLGFWAWSRALERGVAAHHAGLLPIFKEVVEELFSRGLVKVVFATETLALGINMPARSVVLEKLVKWDGAAHVEMTPGEYTQLTGRAGRRGIDVEGHAVVLYRPGMDPSALAGLASKRTYPLNSSFRPTYNMAVNLVADVGFTRAREILEMSFAQFQADRAVVGLARQAQAHADALAGYAKPMTCERGDFGEYMRLRAAIKDRESALSRLSSQAARREVEATVAALTVGDVLQIPGGRRAGFVVVVDPGDRRGPQGHYPRVLGLDKQVRRLSAGDVARAVSVVGHIKLPRQFNERVPASRRDLASSLRNFLTEHRLDAVRSRPRRSLAADDAELARLRRALREHPCHGCPDREDHARWAMRHERLQREHDGLVRRIASRTSSIATVFDRICDLLSSLGYLDKTAVTDAGARLRRIYAEKDLLVAECLRRGLWQGLDPAELAAVASTVVYRPRGEEQTISQLPVGVSARIRTAVEDTNRLWSELEDGERDRGLPATDAIETGLVEPVYAWAGGASLESVLRMSDFAAGDFVRWTKLLIDLLDQLTAVADADLAVVAAQALARVRRGVVAYSSV